MPVSLVTGGAGFMGSHVARHLLDRGHEVLVLDDLSGGFSENVPDGAEFVEGSILDDVLLEYLFAGRRFDYVYHLAAYAAEGLSHFIRRFNYRNNLIGSMNLINAAVNHDVACFVFTSSIAVYGAGQVPMTEDTVPAPEDPYGVAKYAVELDLKAAHEMFGLNSIVFRPHNVYGENQNIGDRYRNVVGIFMNQLLRDEPMTVFGDGEQQRAFTYIDDVAPIIAASVDVEPAYNQVINIGADVPVTVNTLAEEIAGALGEPTRTVHLDPRNEVAVTFSDHRKCAALFGEHRKTALRDGLRRMAEWVQGHGVRESSVFEDIEVERNLPPSWAEATRLAEAR